VFVEGIAPVWQALDSGARLESLLVAPELLTSERALEQVAHQESRGVPVARVSDAAFTSISLRDNPSGLAAIVRFTTLELSALEVSSGSIFVALESPSDPGNIGAIIRTVDAVGGNGLVLAGSHADPGHPTCVRASLGTLFRVVVAHANDVEDVLSWCAQEGVEVVTTSARSGTLYWDSPYTTPLLLLLGSEGRGLSEDILSRGHAHVRIPMKGGASSLNLAVAAGVLLYEISRANHNKTTEEGE
jgi:RNA methyltransferase, TrmH family